MKETKYFNQTTLVLSGETEKIYDFRFSHVIVTNNTNQIVYVSKYPDIEQRKGTIDVLTLMPKKSGYIDCACGVFDGFYAFGTGGIDIKPENSRRACIRYVEMLNRLSEIVRPNLLINPDFRINQRQEGGTITTPGYFVDRWKLVSGSVTVNSDGTLALNGTICQILENAVGTDITASSSAGKASYDNNSKTFSLTALGETISWAKLEVGSTASPFSPPDLAEELSKCQRYLWVLQGSLIRAGLSCAYSANNIVFYMYAPACLRKVPTISYNNITLCDTVSSENKTIESIQVRGCVSNIIKMLIKAAPDSLLTVGSQYELVHVSDMTGILVFDAEL